MDSYAKAGLPSQVILIPGNSHDKMNLTSPGSMNAIPQEKLIIDHEKTRRNMP